jgi:hypothetical protein
MPEYLLLGTFVFILSVLTVWVTRTLQTLGRACYRAFLPSSKSKMENSEVILPRLSESLESLPTPWGWRTSERRSIPVDIVVEPSKPSTRIPWGWPGNATRS